MRQSKYLGVTFDNNWKCTHVGIATVQSNRAKWAGHRSYYYIFERRTSDNQADKMIRLNASEARSIWVGETTVEKICQRRETKKANKFSRKVSYHFI